MAWLRPLVLLLVVVLGLLVWQYNRLVKMRQLTRNAWSDVDVYLKRRADLIPNLVAAVKGYAGHEQSTLERVLEARSRALASPTPTTARAQAEGSLGSGILQVFALAEGYPELKASETFHSLQDELSETERLIASARQYYNACVRDYNTMLETFPSGFFAALYGFRPMEFFEIETASEREAPSVRT